MRDITRAGSPSMVGATLITLNTLSTPGADDPQPALAAQAELHLPHSARPPYMPTFRLFLEGLPEPEIGIASRWTRPANRIEFTVSGYWFRLGVHINLHK